MPRRRGWQPVIASPNARAPICADIASAVDQSDASVTRRRPARATSGALRRRAPQCDSCGGQVRLRWAGARARKSWRVAPACATSTQPRVQVSFQAVGQGLGRAAGCGCYRRAGRRCAARDRGRSGGVVGAWGGRAAAPSPFGPRLRRPRRRPGPALYFRGARHLRCQVRLRGSRAGRAWPGRARAASGGAQVHARRAEMRALLAENGACPVAARVLPARFGASIYPRLPRQAAAAATPCQRMAPQTSTSSTTRPGARPASSPRVRRAAAGAAPAPRIPRRSRSESRARRSVGWRV